ncbi:MAG: type IV pilus assembly protein PilM [Candidatus Omnitrophica bacterium]|nr:type IV pilus assembly protein PilM [Candidatus Omnitrophota bacterium]
MEEHKKKNNDVKKAVKTRIKGLGLDALFHQVDLSQKDDYPLALRSGPDSIELAQMIAKLKANLQQPSPEECLQKKFQLWKQFLAPKPEIRIGLILGPSAIKFIEVKRLNDAFLLSRASYIPIPHIVKGNEDRLEKFITETVAQNFNLHDLRNHPVYTIIPRSDVIVKFITLPTQELSEVKKMISFEAEHHLPLSLNEVEMDYVVTKQENNETMVIVSAIKKGDLAKRLNLFHKLNVSPDAVDISSMALQATMSPITPDTGVTLQINIGSEHTDLNILLKHEVVYTRGLTWGSKTLTDNLAGHLNVSFENAEKIKKENGIILLKSLDNEVKKKISSQACLWADELVKEIERTVQHFQLEKGQQGLNRIILTGGGTKLRHLGEYLKDKLKTKTMTLKASENIQMGCNPDDYQTHFAELSLLLGVVLRGYQPEGVKAGVNLLPITSRHAVYLKKKRLEKIKAFACFAVSGLAILLLPTAFLMIGKAKEGLQKKTIKSMDPKVATVRNLKNKIQTVEDYISTRHSCMALLKEVSILVTMDIIIDSLLFKNNESIALIGEAASHNSVVNLSQKLQESTHIENANIRYTRKTERNSNTVEFEINCILNKE